MKLFMSVFLSLGILSSFATARASQVLTSAQSQWKKALSLGLQDKNIQASDVLRGLLMSSQKEIGQDEILMALARVKYQGGNLSDAIELYGQISSKSDFWLQSLEEKAWAYLKQNKFEKALSLYHTLSAPAFSAQVGPEAYLIGAYSSLRICDYKSVFEIFTSYKAKYKDLAPELQKLSKNPSSPAVERALQVIALSSKKDKKLNWADLGSDVTRLPQFINRDKEISEDMKAGNKYQALNRVMTLVSNDLKDISQITRKLHIVEIEAIQRMSLKDHKEAVTTHVSEQQTNNDISFPKEEETWLDEVTHYQVRAEGCKPSPQVVGVKVGIK